MSEPSIDRRRRWTAGAAIAVILFAGCAKPEAGAPSEASGTGVGAAEGGAPAVKLFPATRADYDAALEKLRGKTVLVDFWATWCGPCTEQLPHTAALAAAKGSQGLAVVTVSMDDPEDARQIALQLSKSGFAAGQPSGSETVRHLVSRDGGGSRSMEAFEIPGGALPHYKLYDRTGKLRETFALDPGAEEQFTSADVERAVDDLLSEASDK